MILQIFELSKGHYQGIQRPPIRPSENKNFIEENLWIIISYLHIQKSRLRLRLNSIRDKNKES
jgi:hypothetical protein